MAKSRLIAEPISRALVGKHLKRNEKDTESAISISKGLVYVGGNKKAYYEVMEIFVSSSEKKREQLISFVDKEDWDSYVIDVHALKSASLAIGAVRLSEFAKKVVQ